MSRNLSTTELQTSVPNCTLIDSSRGGLGNYNKYNTARLTKGPGASHPASFAALPSSSRTKAFKAGRGGAGNFFESSDAEQLIFQFDEEIVKRRETQAPIYSIGRGGLGNMVDERKLRTDRIGSTDSMTSEAIAVIGVRQSFEGALGKTIHKFLRS